jgi:hypothetical protein
VAKTQPADPTFEHWLDWVFNHPVAEPEWYQDENAKLWVMSPVITLDYITRLFEATPACLRSFSDAQASQGLWFLASSMSFDGLSQLYSESVLRSQRQRCINSMYALFKDFFAVHCSERSLHADKRIETPDVNPLNVTCFMWWDFLAHFADGTEGRVGIDMDHEMLLTMERILQLDHEACIESALHGLGHWQRLCPVEAATIIDRFLASNPDLHQELRTYALNAQAGHVL